jgi:DhnA family fructose-bisphosphate aldolase class Ia
VTGLLVLAADHRARGVMTVEPYAGYLAALRAALPHADGVLASAQPLADLARCGIEPRHRTYLSINRTGLSGSVFEVDDRLVASVPRAKADGWTGVKFMVRIDPADARTSAALELLGRVLEDARDAGLDALIEAVPWRDGQMGHEVDDIVRAAVVAHDLGSPLLKVPLPSASPGEARTEAVARVVASVGAPVLVLGGPRQSGRDAVLSGIRDAMAGGAAGVAVGRVVIEDRDPASMAALVAEAVHHR